jgi:hypothetical protein
MSRVFLIASLLIAAAAAPATSAPAKCEAAMSQVMECHQACQDSHFDAPGLKQCEDKCPSTPKGCADGTDKAPEK